MAVRIKFYHIFLFLPTMTTLNNTIKAGFFVTLPTLTTKCMWVYLPPPTPRLQSWDTWMQLVATRRSTCNCYTLQKISPTLHSYCLRHQIWSNKAHPSPHYHNAFCTYHKKTHIIELDNVPVLQLPPSHIPLCPSKHQITTIVPPPSFLPSLAPKIPSIFTHPMSIPTVIIPPLLQSPTLVIQKWHNQFLEVIQQTPKKFAPTIYLRVSTCPRENIHQPKGSISVLFHLR